MLYLHCDSVPIYYTDNDARGKLEVEVGQCYLNTSLLVGIIWYGDNLTWFSIPLHFQTCVYQKFSNRTDVCGWVYVYVCVGVGGYVCVCVCVDIDI